jgi:PIN domain nuclease of toxin-antitoxin system
METGRMIYLDTHVAVWLYAFGAKKLSERASVLIERSPKLLISPMVLLELEFLHEIGKLAVAPQALCGYLADSIALEICQREFQEVVRGALQQTWTRDPFDRMITAQAALNNDVLITKDRFIRNHYPRATW